MALNKPFPDSDFLVKNDTVKGIIGKTQGVSNAIKPPNKPKKNIFHKLLPSVGGATPQS